MLAPAGSKPSNVSAVHPNLVVLPKPKPEPPEHEFFDIYKTRYRIHPLIQQKLIKRAVAQQLLGEVLEMAAELREKILKSDEETDEELFRIYQGKDPFSDPI